MPLTPAIHDAVIRRPVTHRPRNAGWSVLALHPPAPAPADAPARSSAPTRAFEHVQQIAAQTHVAGSAEDQQVVERSRQTLTALGLDTEVQNSVGAPRLRARARPRWRGCRNVVARPCPGTDPTGRLYLMAHHDSVENGPGGNDDAAGVSPAAGDGARADRRAAAAQRRRRRPHRRRGGVPLRRRGVRLLALPGRRRGRGAQLRGPRHHRPAGHVRDLARQRRPRRAFADGGPAPGGHQLRRRGLPRAAERHRLQRLLADGGFTGLNTAYIDGAAAYHTPQDARTGWTRPSLQAMGDNALALVRELGDRDLPRSRTRPATTPPTSRSSTGWSAIRARLVWPLAAAALVGVALLALVVLRPGHQLARTDGRRHRPAAVPLVLGPLAVQGLGRCSSRSAPGTPRCSTPGAPARSDWPPSRSSSPSSSSGTRSSAGGSGRPRRRRRARVAGRPGGRPRAVRPGRVVPDGVAGAGRCRARHVAALSAVRDRQGDRRAAQRRGGRGGARAHRVAVLPCPGPGPRFAPAAMVAVLVLVGPPCRRAALR